MIIEGIAFYKNAFIHHDTSVEKSGLSFKPLIKSKTKNYIKSYYLFLIKTAPYGVLLTLGSAYFYVPEGITNLVKFHYHWAICLHVVIIFIILYEINKGIKNLNCNIKLAT